MSVVEQVLTALGGLAAVVIAIAAACFGLFRVFGERWMAAKFDEKLAAYRHEQQKELEQLRFKISSLLDRTTKLHQREFEVLPEAWAKLVYAYSATIALTSPVQSYPDLDRMTPAHLTEFLEKSPLASWERNELSQASKKTDYYSDHIFWHRLNEARSYCRESYAYLRRHGIFVQAEIKEKFSTLDDLVWNALGEHEINAQMKLIPRITERGNELRSKGEALLKDLETIVQGRLWTSATNLSVD